MAAELPIGSLSSGSARATGSIGGLLVIGHVFGLVIAFVVFFSSTGGFGLRNFFSYGDLAHACVRP